MKHIGVVIPACNEEQYIAQCLTAIDNAKQAFEKHIKFKQSSIQHSSLINAHTTSPNLNKATRMLSSDSDQYSIKVVIVLDHCQDETEAIVQSFGVEYLTVDYQCVGQSRHHGIECCIDMGCDWICCTDADSMVSENWFVEMMHHQPIDLICGVVDVDSWDHLSELAQQKYRAHYQDWMGHHHIHGANLCFKTEAYKRVGGFNFLKCHEDIDLVKRMQIQGCQIIWSNRVRVTTSARLSSKVTEGFAGFLKQLDQEHCPDSTL